MNGNDRRRMAVAIAISLLWPSISPALDSHTVALTPRPGVTLNIIVQRPSEKPYASLVLFEGGPGKVTGRSGKGGFMIEHQEALTGKGFVTALVDAPSDRPKGLLGGFRLGRQHLTDIRAVVRHLRETEQIPIWLVGISLGTQSVANAGINLPGQIDGLVLLSSKTRPQPVGKPITDLDLGRIRVPVLVGAHARDACPGTPPIGAQEIVKALIHSPSAVVRTFDGGRSTSGPPCLPGSPHTFAGLESKVIEAVSAFIVERAGDRPR